MIYQSHHWRAARSRDCSSQRTERERRSIERGVYALSCGAVSLVEFTVNHIAFIARFSSLSSVGSIHFKLIPIRISSPVYNRDLDTHLEIMWEIKHVGDFFSLSPLTSFFFFCNRCRFFVDKKKKRRGVHLGVRPGCLAASVCVLLCKDLSS